MDRETSMFAKWKADITANPVPEHFTDKVIERSPEPQRLKAPAVVAPLSPYYRIRPHCIGAALRHSFEFSTALKDTLGITNALFSDLPLSENGWSRATVRLDFVSGNRWRLSRKQEG